MTLPTTKRERIKLALRKRSVFVFYLAALATAFVMTYPEADHKKENTHSSQQQEIQLQPTNFDFKELRKHNERLIYSI